jgi:hypothetical protein
VAAQDGAVELVVSDNCSADGTAGVIEAARRRAPLRYHRTPENVGVSRNILLLVEHLAAGEYCWLIGDDDMLVRGGLERVVASLRHHRELDALVVNYYLAPLEHRDRLVRELGGRWAPPERRALWDAEAWWSEREDRPLGRWEDALALPSARPPLTFTSILGHVFSRAVWLQHADRLRTDDMTVRVPDTGMPSLDDAYPHLKVLAHAMVGRAAFYIGDPVAVQSVDTTAQWRGFSASIVVSRVNEALGLYEELGVDQSLVRAVRRSYVERGGVLEGALDRLLRDRSAPGRKSVSMRRLFVDNREFAPQLAAMLLRILGRASRNQLRHLPTPLRRLARSARRAAAGSR